MSSFKGRIALVTGGSRGIGAATVKALAAGGAAVAALARDGAACEALAGEIRSGGGKALGAACDVSRPEEVTAAVERVRTELGSPTVLINNAGVIEPIGKLADCPAETWLKSVRINLGGAFLMARTLLPDMERQGGGTIVNISSGAAHQPLEGWSAYCAGKAGLAMLTRALDLEYRSVGIRVFGFAPGVVDTEMQGKIRASGINAVSRLPRAELLPAERPARVIAWLCGSESDDLAGQELSIRDPQLCRRAGLEEVEG